MTSFTFVLLCTLEACAKAFSPNESYSLAHKNILSESFARMFLERSKTVCEYESLTFLSEEARSLYEKAKSELQAVCIELTTQLARHRISVTERFTVAQWRLFVAMTCSFWEWCEDTQFFVLSEGEQKAIFSENPLVSLPQFL